MTAQAVEKKHGANGGWIDQAVFALDRWLCRRQGIFEYTSRADCLFRIQLCCAEQHTSLADGTRVRAGEPMLKLHLWNEHVPPMGQSGATFGWARQISRAVDHSLRELAYYLVRHPKLASVRVLGGDMRLGDSKQRAQFVHIARRYGFEAAELRAVPWREALHRIGDTLLILLLVLATNPIALRRTPLRHIPSRVFISRAALWRRYGRGLTSTRTRLSKPKIAAAPLPEFGKSSS